MTFKADNAQMRTFDSERGIELKWERAAPDGTALMSLETPAATLRFTMRTSFEPTLESAKPLIVRHVSFRGIPLGGFTVERTQELIVEALEAFKGMHGRHPDEVVRVVFE